MTPTDGVDVQLLPVDLEQTTNCACFDGSNKFLHAFFDEADYTAHTNKLQLNDDIRSELSNNDHEENNDNVDCDVGLDNEVDDGGDDVVMYCQYFPIKGAAQEERYQDPLQMFTKTIA